MTAPPQRTCAVCTRILNVYEHPDGTHTWVHGLQDETEDHPAVPVAPNTLPTAYRCDFCNMDESAYILPSRDFPLPGAPNTMAGEDWSACAECARLIDLNQWSALMRRSMSHWKIQHGEEMSDTRKASLGILWRALRKHITGTLKPFVKPDMENPRPHEGTGGPAIIEGQARTSTALRVDRTGRQDPDTV